MAKIFLQRNLGRKTLSEISSSEEWKCLVCNPTQIFEQRALYYALYVNQKELIEKRLNRKENQARCRLEGYLPTKQNSVGRHKNLLDEKKLKV
jgi:hypothetical protein